MEKKVLRIVLLCCMLAILLTGGVAAVNTDNLVASGTCGESGSNLSWTLDSTGNLTISGTGAMANYNQLYRLGNRSYVWTSAPWGNNRNLITSVTVRDGVTSIGKDAFLSLEHLSKVTIPNSVVRIHEEAFRNCPSLIEIHFPDSVASIADGVFQQCSNLVRFTISNNVINIGSNAFRDCDRLSSITIPESVMTIGVSAFQGCDRLQRVTILGNLSAIRTETFRDCPSLAEIAIPDSILFIEENAFANSNALTDVYYSGSKGAWLDISMDTGNPSLVTARIHYEIISNFSYWINSVSVSETDGSALSMIPDHPFLASVSVTNRQSDMPLLLFLTAYNKKGQYEGLMYVKVEESVGTTITVTLPVDNTNGNIGQLKAFAIASFADMTPFGNAVSFPAE